MTEAGKVFRQEYLGVEPEPCNQVVNVNCGDGCCEKCGPVLQVPFSGTYDPQTWTPQLVLPVPALGKCYQLAKFDLKLTLSNPGKAPQQFFTEKICASMTDKGTPNQLGLYTWLDMQPPAYVAPPAPPMQWPCACGSQEIGKGIKLQLNAGVYLDLNTCANGMPVGTYTFDGFVYFQICDSMDCNVEYILPEPPPPPPVQCAFNPPKTIGLFEDTLQIIGPGPAGRIPTRLRRPRAGDLPGAEPAARPPGEPAHAAGPGPR